MKETILMKIKRMNNDVDKYIKPNASVFVKTKVFFDMLWERYIYDNELIDYIQYNFYFKKRAERNKFITHGKLLEIMRICNNKESRKYFNHKPLFNKSFNEYLGRSWFDASNASQEQLKEFLLEHKQLFSKDPDGMFGKGVEKVCVDEIKNIDEYVSTAINKGLLFEEVIEQHDELAQFNDTSVNSLRVVTLVCADNEVRVMAAVLRIGRKGQVADNFHHYGIAALIDVETGIVYTAGVDRNRIKYVVHPDSKKPIVGFKIPQWDEIINTVKIAATIHSDVRYVGWDVTINNKGKIVLIEGNPGADPDILQIEDQVGKWYLFEPLLDEIKRKGV